MYVYKQIKEHIQGKKIDTIYVNKMLHAVLYKRNVKLSDFKITLFPGR